MGCNRQKPPFFNHPKSPKLRKTPYTQATCKGLGWCECWDSNPERSCRRAMFYPVRLHSHKGKPFYAVFPSIKLSKVDFWTVHFTGVQGLQFFRFTESQGSGAKFYYFLVPCKTFIIRHLPMFSSPALRVHFGYWPGIEPTTFAVGGRHSIQLRYGCIFVFCHYTKFRAKRKEVLRHIRKNFFISW